ncbi:holo-ACP synthase [Paenibacillus terrae]|uniref:Holo-[acyl-carrier-protein] synthase n=1 Tax=Paenibacillus terrae (strain HPL-003) TaxID=985665 RepID=G7VYP6_PAETH|nr:holo-ACP synthase [Paenibacillus terrae]AET59036.1 4-phosphopantetheinyl transferase [Paenibacillus terrae HPL-003]
MIYGIGHDVLEISRMADILAGKHADAFLNRVLTPAERDLAVERKGRLAEFVAGRFAAKEAITKAFGCGIGQIIGFGDMDILPEPGGKPAVYLSAPAWDRLGLPGAGGSDYSIHLSITHQPNIASAFVIVEYKET